ncbi:hypothetical protein [Flavobacterium silvaticum]|uniref:Uncharacterized protein n=1 Tax=Flavobacterium silvaticum TaxID=1852020 RepID=A0A972FMB2_9FLAO|nr:hypothetical protein [Flavobacterium silvaticum]NMH27835.1 hypothetical protein [Flavobacterium silvaticum]
MKKIKMLLLIILFSNCRQENVIEKPKVAVSAPKRVIETSAEKENAEDKMLAYLKQQYSEVFFYSDDILDEEESLQQLGVTYLDENTIDFYLYTETLPCDTEYYGKAFRVETDSLSDIQDALEIFVKEEKEFKLSVILDKQTHKAKVAYIDKETLGTDCLPIVETHMEKVK